jgi:branched-chain amino acid transport system permease protein
MAFQIVINGLIAGLLTALVALGFSLIYSSTRFFHVAHGAIYALASYVFLGWALILGSGAVPDPGWFIPVGVLLALALVSVVAVALEMLIYRPLYLRTASPLVIFLSSLGLYIIIVNLIALLFGNETRLLNPHNESPITLGPVVVTKIQILQAVISAVTIFIVFVLLKRTSLGRNIRAMSDNPTLVGVLGLDPKKIRLLIFFTGSILAALSSLLRGFDVGVNPYVGLPIVLIATVAVIIGGIGSHVGAVISALLLGITQNLVTGFFSATWKEAVTFVVFILVLMLRRQGLFASRMRLEEQ